MPNLDKPNGFRPLTPGAIAHPYTAGGTFAAGDLLVLQAAGTVVVFDIATHTEAVGVAATPGVAATDCLVYDDPTTQFIGQCSGTYAATQIGDVVDVEGTTGIQEIDENATVVGVVKIVDQYTGQSGAAEVGANSRVVFQIARHTLSGLPDTGILDGVMSANSVLKADTVNVPVALAVGASTIVGRGAAGSIAALTPAQTRVVVQTVPSDAAPAALGVAAAGASADYSRTDHVHAHGDLVGGTLHAAVGAAAGFMAAADKTKIDGIEALADVTDAVNVDAAGAVMNTDYNAQTVIVAVLDNTPVIQVVADSEFVGRAAAGNVGVMTAVQARIVLNVENGADVTDDANVRAALAAATAVVSFNNQAIGTVGTVDGRDVSADGALLDVHLGAGANLHDATEVDFDLADASKSVIAAASDTVEAALVDLDTHLARSLYAFTNEDFYGAALVSPWASAETSPAGAPTLGFIADARFGRYELTCDGTNEAQVLRLDWADSLHLDPTTRLYAEFGFRWTPAGAAGDLNTQFFVGLISNYNADYDLITRALGLRVIGANMNLLLEADDGVTDTSVDTTLDIIKNNLTKVRFDFSTLATVRCWIDIGAGAGWQYVTASTPNMGALVAADLLQPCFLMQKNAAAAESIQADYCKIWVAGR